MTFTRSRSWTRARNTGAVLALACLVAGAWPGQAWAQACCASAGLVAPTRLRSYEDLAVGVQARARSVFGAFAADTGYAGNGAGDAEWETEQDLFAVARVLGRGQVSLLVPFVETHRNVGGLAETGGGVGDVAVNARFDFIETGERGYVPGVAALVGLVLPTGTPPDEASGMLATGATGQGSVELSAGVGLDEAVDPYFVTGNVLVGFRTSRDVAGIHESFAPRLTLVGAVGRTLPHGATVGVFASGLRQGENRDQSGAIAGSDVSLLTTGLASTLSVGERWRLQGTLSGNLPISGMGRNQTAGVGLSVALMRLWL